ncbi:MAG: formate dehydrogenase accessory sulfurtransferase FdhD [Burkholderiales bacterium]|nr:formate dehydrogenase accessory sulfurtransferase FdhD [Burkholderiales bacterium]
MNNDSITAPEGLIRLQVIRSRGTEREAAEDALLAEVPVALVYNGISHAVMLASPLDLEDFALGFSLTEGIVDSAADLLDVEVTPHTLEGGAAGLTVDLRVTQRCFMRLKEKRRNLTGRTGCGLCGTENLSEAVRPVPARVPQVDITPAALQRGMAELASSQALQQATGASHAAAFCALGGELLCVREDVGRHNALDKLIGWLARSGHRADQGFICVTSRASYEMVFKTASAGVGLLAAISAPTALAVRTADAAGLTLLGYVRADRATVYGSGRGFLLP